MQATPAYQKLKPNSIDLWVTPVEQYKNHLSEFKEALTKDESIRAQRYHFDKDKLKFIISRGRLRKLIEHYLGIAAKDAHLTTNPYGKPFLDQNHHSSSGRLYFNVSHSHEMIIYAFGLTPHLGIDIEHMKQDRSLDDLADRCYTENELTYYNATNNKIETFYKLWSHKEAYLKAIGTGLSTSLKDFETNLSNNKHSIITEHNIFDKTLQWHAIDLALFNDYQAALVTNTQIANTNIMKNEHAQ